MKRQLLLQIGLMMKIKTFSSFSSLRNAFKAWYCYFSNFLIQNHKDKDFLAFLNKNENLALAENEFLGVDHISFLGFLLHRWNFDDVLIESICFVRTPHAAREEVKKSAYALAITDHLFAPHDGSSPFNAKAAVALLEEAKTQGINFDLNNLLSKLPSKAKENLNKED